jgi:hypothetical protein
MSRNKSDKVVMGWLCGGPGGWVMIDTETLVEQSFANTPNEVLDLAKNYFMAHKPDVLIEYNQFEAMLAQIRAYEKGNDFKAITDEELLAMLSDRSDK